MAGIKATPGREIKFRAWDEANKTMWHVREINFGHKAVMCTQNPDERCPLVVRIPMEELEVMQYTGMPDKNKQDVYEGDICDTHTRFGKGVVIFESGIYKISGISLCTFRELEVIGNVHDNPGLLE